MSIQIETNATYIKYQSNYYLREESKNSVKKRQHKIKQTNYSSVFKIQSKQKKNKKDRVEVKPYIY